MQTLSKRSHALETRQPPRRGLALRILDWLAEKDRLHREGRGLRRMARERLDDVGLSRQDVERGFRGQ